MPDSATLGAAPCNHRRSSRESDPVLPANVVVTMEGEVSGRSGILVMAIVVAACSSDTTPVPPSDPQASAALLKKDCEDPKWREENLGLWYSVCRQPLRW